MRLTDRPCPISWTNPGNWFLHGFLLQDVVASAVLLMMLEGHLANMLVLRSVVAESFRLVY